MDIDVPPVETINWISSGGLVTTLFVILWLGMSKRWRWGYQFDEMVAQLKAAEEREARIRAERDTWIQRTLRLMNVADNAIETSKAVVQKMEG